MNIVFDLGGVVFQWRPDAIIKSVFDDPGTQNSVRTHIFEHSDWVELDRGTIALDHAVERGAARTGLPRRDIERLMNAVPRSLAPIEETIALIRTIRETNNKLFVLSNMSLASISYLEQKYRIWEMFNGIVISCRIRKVKPEIDIYEHLLATHGLEAAETVFIDDMSENLKAAATLGIETIQFVDPSQCRQALMALRCL